MEINELKIEAERVFGSRERSLLWLSNPNRRLVGKSPLEAFATPEGAELVSEMLVQIDHGMFV